MVRIVFVTLVACVALTACFNEDPFVGVWKNDEASIEIQLNRDGTGFSRIGAEKKITWRHINGDKKIVISYPIEPSWAQDMVMELRYGVMRPTSGPTSGRKVELSKMVAAE